MAGMTQTSIGLDWPNKRTRKREFLGEMERVVPWSALVALIEPHSPRAKTGRPPLPIETMLRIHFMQNWFTFGGQAMEEALIDTPLYREFARLNVDAERLGGKFHTSTTKSGLKSRFSFESSHMT